MTNTLQAANELTCYDMNSYSEVQAFRGSDEATAFSRGWLAAQRRGEVTSDYHMNLLAWSSSSPFHALGIVLNLVDFVGDDDSMAKQIALGPVDFLFNNAPAFFASILRDAVSEHPAFARNAHNWDKTDDLHADK